MAIQPLQLPSNVTAVPYVPHAAILPRIDGLVTHAGHGTMMAALAYGVPIVCMLMGRDQHYNAACVTAAGAGVTIAAGSRADEIAQAIDHVSRAPGYKNGAARLQAAIAARLKQNMGVIELEQLGMPLSGGGDGDLGAGRSL